MPDVSTIFDACYDIKALDSKDLKILRSNTCGRVMKLFQSQQPKPLKIQGKGKTRRMKQFHPKVKQFHCLLQVLVFKGGNISLR